MKGGALHCSDKISYLDNKTTNSCFSCSPHQASISNKPLPKPDWSRSSRNSLALLKAACDPQQTKITSFFQVVSDIERFIQNVPHIEEMFNKTQYQGANDQDSKQQSLIHCLMSNATKNCAVLPHQRRHEEILKKFATSLFIYCGSLSYNFLHQNLPNAIPSLRTVQRIVSKEYNPLHEGEFRFDELLMHLNLYKCSKVVAIGEDATRIIARVEYDSESDRLVGFVLPCNDEGLPILSSFSVANFDSIKKAFQTGDVAKLAFVYMAQPLSEGVPAFCLACLGTNNKFTSDLLLKRWKYIYTECQKRGIHVASFGADGDSRELRAMQLSTMSNSPMVLNKHGSLSIPSAWSKWYAQQNTTGIAYVQDTVHVAVKLKARLLKPSIVLPLGRFTAGAYHILQVQSLYGKDKHGLRKKDISHKDKQNFDAVIHLTSNSVMTLLSENPDAQGTVAYLRLIQDVVDSYLDKTLNPLQRLEKAWHAVYFVRYWRAWLVNSSDYNLKNNFITSNAYTCIELNAHALIVFLLALRDTCQSHEAFLPWMLGSQSCEKIFRAARSLSSTFSTVINFALLGLLQRLHRLHIQFCLQAERGNTGIKYPQVDSHKNKEGHSKQDSITMLSSLTNNKIAEAVETAKKKAQEVIQSLGMAEELEKSKCWDDPPIPNLKGMNIKEEDEEEDENDDDNMEDLSSYEVPDYADDPMEIQTSIQELEDSGIVDKDLKSRLDKCNKLSFKRLPKDKAGSVPMYDVKSSENEKKITKARSKHRPYIEISHCGKSVYIHKTTAVWLLQEGEQLSTDRLFRVRNKQPFMDYSDSLVSDSDLSSSPAVCKVIHIGDICAFRYEQYWQIGRVLQFSYYREKTKRSQQYSGNFVNLSDNADKIGVLCSWYTANTTSSSDASGKHQTKSLKLSLCNYEGVHTFRPISTYICSLPRNSFDLDEKSAISDSIVGSHDELIDISTAKDINMKYSALSFIEDLMKTYTIKDCDEKVSNNSRVIKKFEGSGSDCWVRQDSIVLKLKDRQEVLRGKELTDMQINAFQFLLKKEFQHIDGLLNTLLLSTLSLELQEEKVFLQVLHVRSSHWIALKICGNETCVYDSSYTTLSKDTMESVARLVQSKDRVVNVKIMNTAKQFGSADCGLFALATLTSLALGSDPLMVIFDQKELRKHYVRTLESGIVTAFPILKNRRPATRYKIEPLKVYCTCRLPDNGGRMIGCDGCDEWFHYECLPESSIAMDKEKWFCSQCVNRNL